MVWMAEFINAAVEAAIDLSTSEFHPMAKVGKDVASAAVLLGVVASIIIGLIILLHPCWSNWGWVKSRGSTSLSRKALLR